MPKTKSILKKYTGFLFAFGCSFLVLYMLTVSGQKGTKFYSIDTANWECSNGRMTLRTADSEICLGNTNIFFIETASSISLNARQACAVESASRYHPSHDILLLMTPDGAIDFNNTLMKLLDYLVNVRIIKINIANLVHGTPFYEWYQSNIWRNSQYKVTHMSDALRLFLLYMYGGMYLDMDVVVFRSLAELQNCLVSDNGVNAGSSVLFFDKGHPFLQVCIKDFVEHYNPNLFADNGPPLIHRNLKHFCKVENVKLATRESCDVEVWPMEKAYPIPFQLWEDYFRPSPAKRLGNKFNSSYLMHAWNWLSKGRSIDIGKNSLYELAMKEHCPLVYKYSQQFKTV